MSAFAALSVTSLECHAWFVWLIDFMHSYWFVFIYQFHRMQMLTSTSTRSVWTLHRFSDLKTKLRIVEYTSENGFPVTHVNPWPCNVQKANSNPLPVTWKFIIWLLKIVMHPKHLKCYHIKLGIKSNKTSSENRILAFISVIFYSPVRRATVILPIALLIPSHTEMEKPEMMFVGGLGCPTLHWGRWKALIFFFY